MRSFAPIAAGLMLLAPLVSRAELTRPKRLDYLRTALSAYQAAAPAQIRAIHEFVTMVSRGACRSDFESLRAPCLEQQARRNCASATAPAGALCPVLSDIIVVNELNEGQFVSREERIQTLSHVSASSGNASSNAYSELLLRKYSTLATELLLSKPSCAKGDVPCLAATVDDYCLQNSDVKGLPWQACVSAMVWTVSRADMAIESGAKR